MGNPHATFDEAGNGNQLTVRLVRHSQRNGEKQIGHTYGAGRHSSTLLLGGAIETSASFEAWSAPSPYPAATGTAERDAALEMLQDIPGSERVTVGGDKGFDTADFVRECRNIWVTPHVAQNLGRRGGSAIDSRTTRQEGYAISQKKRKRIEECFGWLKTIRSSAAKSPRSGRNPDCGRKTFESYAVSYEIF